MFQIVTHYYFRFYLYMLFNIFIRFYSLSDLKTKSEANPKIQVQFRSESQTKYLFNIFLDRESLFQFGSYLRLYRVPKVPGMIYVYYVCLGISYMFSALQIFLSFWFGFFGYSLGLWIKFQFQKKIFLGGKILGVLGSPDQVTGKILDLLSI